MTEFKPTPEQERALTCPAPLLVLAGAGTGKTSVLTHRIAQRIAAGQARPDQVLALTFTDKAAAEMAERLCDILGESGLADEAREVAVKTFHSFGRRVIEENFLRLGFDRPPSVLTRAAAWQLLSHIFNDLSFDALEISTGRIAGVFSGLLSFFSQCKDHLVTADDLDAYALALDSSQLAPVAAEHVANEAAILRDLAAAYRRYDDVKREKGVVDFGDLLVLPVQLFRSSAVRVSYRRRYPFVFVDEYQDTNHAQRLLLLELIDPARPLIMVIGDDDQAIYRWRGAVVHNILRFPRESIFAPGQVEEVRMTQNRRSYRPILDLANLAISEVRDRNPKDLGYHPKNDHGRATIGHYTAASDSLEGRWIAARIRALEPEARQFPDKKRGYGAFAILCRRRSLFEPVGQALEAAGIPFELVGGTGFYGRWEIRDILSYLRVLASPADDLALARILRSRRLRLCSRDLFHLGRWVRQQNGDRGRGGEGREGMARLHLLDAVLHNEDVAGLSSAARTRLLTLREELERWSEDRQELSLPDLVARVVEDTGYRRELLARPGFDARVSLLNLAKLEDLARQFEEGTEGADLGGFVEFVSYAVESGEEEGEVRPIDEESDTVKVMTVHQSKGLEFPIVLVPGLVAGTFPATRRSSDDKWRLPFELRGDREYLPTIDLASVRTRRDLEDGLKAQKQAGEALDLDEERRLFYVAITRAQYHLYLSRAHWYGARKTMSGPSRFWDLVETSGFSENLGQEECPAENPNLALDSAVGDATEDTASNPGANLASLLLPGKDPASWIEETIRTACPGAGEGDSTGQSQTWKALRAAVDAHLERLVSPKQAIAEEKMPGITCSGVVDYLACPRRYRYKHVDGLPTRPSPRAALGREVHRRIEEMSWPIAPVPRGPVKEEMPDEDEFEVFDEQNVATTDTGGSHRSLERMLAHFRDGIYGQRPATHVEVAFQLPLRLGTLRGRMDRVDCLPDGRWEVVDFKATSRPDVAGNGFSLREWATLDENRSSSLAGYCRQLGLYALSLREVWKVPAAKITAHLVFLQDGTDLDLAFDDADLDRIRDGAEETLAAIAGGEFPMATGSPACSRCEYNHLCQE